MQRFVAASLLLCALFFSGIASADEVSHRQLAEELIGLSHARQIVTDWRGRFDEQAEELVDTVTGGSDEEDLTQEERHAVEVFKARGYATLDGALSWDTLHDVVLNMYVQAFSEDDLQKIVDFLKTPAGGKLLDNLPVLTDGVTGVVRQKIDSIRPHLGEIEHDFRTQYGEEESATSIIRSVPVNPPVPPGEIVRALQPPVLTSGRAGNIGKAPVRKKKPRYTRCKDHTKKFPHCSK